MLYALDLETDGLDERRNKITCVGIWSPHESIVLRDKESLVGWLNDHPHATFVGHNFKFDLKFLKCQWNIDLAPQTSHDTMLMAAVYPYKPTDEYLEKYEQQRQKENEQLPHGVSHRKAGALSLKVQAPFFLGVKPFWETPDNHDNDEYVLKDCEYTYRLHAHYQKHLGENYEFYSTKLFPWTYEVLLPAELAGVRVDQEALKDEELKSQVDAAKAKRELEAQWADHYEAYLQLQAEEVKQKYEVMREKAIAKAKDKDKAKARYDLLEDNALKKLKPMNLASPKQLLWVLKDRMKLPIKRLDNGEESTGKSVLERLAQNGHKEIEPLLRYRKASKLATAFFPSYQEKLRDGRIHTTFNATGTRTGRLSSSGPNLQQVPGHLHKLFIPDEGKIFATYDESAVEARLIAEVTFDPVLKMICDNGWSIHDYNTKHIFFDYVDCEESEVKAKFPRERAVSKTVGFALYYGAGWRRIQFAAIAQGFNWSEQKCKSIHRKFKDIYEDVFTFKNEILDPAFMRKQVMINLFGRPIYFNNPEDVYMKGFNTLIQSSASDLVQESALKINRGGLGEVRLLVHDELVVQGDPKDADKLVDNIKHCMTDYNLSLVKLEVEGNVEKYWQK